MAFVGLIPSEHSSGTKQARGAITKTGNAHLRRVLVEAAWHYRHHPFVGDTLRARQRGAPPTVIAHAWTAQHRLHRRYARSYYDAPTPSEGSSRMRGPDEQTKDLFSYLSPEQRVRPDHPLRAIRRMTDAVLRSLSPRFTKMYSDIGRPSIPPEQLLRALLLQALYTVRSERLLMEDIDYSVLFRWFIGLSMDDPIW